MAVLSETPLVYALVGNPNCGKSTLFNALTGLRHARKHLSAYADHAGANSHAGGAAMRLRLVTTDCPIEARNLLARMFEFDPLTEAA